MRPVAQPLAEAEPELHQHQLVVDDPPPRAHRLADRRRGGGSRGTRRAAPSRSRCFEQRRRRTTRGRRSSAASRLSRDDRARSSRSAASSTRGRSGGTSSRSIALGRRRRRLPTSGWPSAGGCGSTSPRPARGSSCRDESVVRRYARVEPDERELAGAVVDRRLEPRPRSRRHVVDATTSPRAIWIWSRDELRDRLLGRFELVVAREVFEQVAERCDAERCGTRAARAGPTPSRDSIGRRRAVRTED